MAASTSFLISSSFLPLRPLHRNTPILSTSRTKAHNDGVNNGRLVDESMVVLRLRIHEMKLADKNYEPPAEWMWWEKQIYGDYDAFICDVIGLLQSQMMETRPAVVVGLSAILALSLPISAATVAFQMVRIVGGVLAGGVHFQ
ncbi:uncharacterized protein LOC124937105 [Impatiens glandulifera]|uniref:uncharacterized protein LOC124937105 n=1 Tax=Impatiens glandulifera TaxID=253017 RepID=UPI001FB09BBC|nr:uncharacterized protein LOC124937105 [Impatiens glandulifera]